MAIRDSSDGRGVSCRFCDAPLHRTFVDLGMSPLCQTHISPEMLNHMEPFYPLHAYICEQCFLVQLEEYVSPGEIFSEYAYFSSYSVSWVEHARKYKQKVCDRFNLGKDSMVMEIASNDGYLLQHFVQDGINVLGIEPAANVAKAAVEKGVPTVVKFFGEEAARELAREYGKADLLLGNNVLAHVPKLNDFVAGMKLLLQDDGVITMEFPHLLQLIDQNQFDTIYHEHFSYLSFFVVEKVFARHGITLFDVEEIPTHGGSLRIYGRHDCDHSKPVTDNVVRLRAKELSKGLAGFEIYDAFTEKVKNTKRNLLKLLIQIKQEGKAIAGYGAPGKGNTLLNYCGIRTDFLDYTVDKNPYKQGKYTPGTRIPIFGPEKIRESRPDYILILPWNLKEEIIGQLDYIREWGGQFIVPIPEPAIFP